MSVDQSGSRNCTGVVTFVSKAEKARRTIRNGGKTHLELKPSELPIGIPFSISYRQLARLKVLPDGTSQLPELKDSLFIVRSQHNGVEVTRVPRFSLPEPGESVEISPLQLQTLDGDFLQTGVSSAPEYQNCRFAMDYRPGSVTITRVERIDLQGSRENVVPIARFTSTAVRKCES